MSIGRNESCICGSGKKYKKCCMKKNMGIPSLIMNKKQSCTEEEYLYECFNLANSKLDTLSSNNWIVGEYRAIEKLYEEIINSENIYSFTGGAYVNYAQLIMATNKIEDFNGQVILDERIETYLKKALEIKPTNQVALHLLTMVYHMSNRYVECLEIINNDNINKQQYDEFMNLVSNVDANYNIYMANPKLLSRITAEKIDYYRELLRLAKNTIYEVQIEYIYAMYLKYSGDHLTAYNLLKNRVDKYTNFNGYYGILGELCMPGYLNRPDESLKYYDKCLENIKDDKSMLRVNVNSNRALCYIELKEFEKSIDILEKQIINNPNNTDLYNLSRAYFALGKYDLALSNIKKSMYFSEDELGYYMYGKILRALGETSEAIKYLKKAMYFLENEDLNFNVSNKDINMTSIVIGDLSEKYELIFDELVLTYLDTKDYEYAYIINSMAIEKLPYLDKFKNYHNIINSFIDITKRSEVFEIKITELEDERKRNRELTDKNNKFRDWAGELLKLQNNMDLCINEVNDSDWSMFEREMDKIIDGIRKKSQSVDSYKVLKAKFKEMYPDLNNKALESLTTGEYLFAENKENIMDFAPIIISLSKALEIQMNEVLKLKPEKTIGQIQFIIRNMNKRLEGVDNLLEKVRKIRNSAAHTGDSTKNKVEELREILFSKDGLESIINL